MHSIPYCSMHMPIGWNGLSILTEGVLGACPLSVLILRSGSVPYMMKVILTHIPAECRVVDHYVYRFLNGSA